MTCACRPVLAHHLDGPALLRRRPLAQWRPTRRHVLATAVQGPSGGSEGSDADKLRMLPLVGGATGFVACLVNRTTSQVSPVFDSSSSQSRADVLVIVMSAVLLLTGLSWLSLRPRVVDAVELEGEPVSFVDAGLPRVAREEMEWAWEAASTSAGATSMVVFCAGRCVMHMGLAARGHRAGSSKPGEICRKATASGQASYFSNLAPYPGRVELTAFLPENSQAAIVQPIGTRGVLVLGHNRVRGFTKLDQAWVSSLADKMDATLEGLGWQPAGKGFR